MERQIRAECAVSSTALRSTTAPSSASPVSRCETAPVSTANSSRRCTPGISTTRPSAFIGVVSHVAGACIGSSAGSALRAHARAARSDALAMRRCVLRGKNTFILSDPTLYSPAQHPIPPPSYPARHAAIPAIRLPAGPQDSAPPTRRDSARACRSSSCSRPYGPTVPVTSGCRSHPPKGGSRTSAEAYGRSRAS